MMRKLFLISCLVPCVAVLVGCPKKGDGADAADNTPVAVVDAAPAAPALPVAKNTADVARFPAGEKALTDDDQKILDPFTQVRTSPNAGGFVGGLKAGTDPFKIAEFQNSMLVSFADPKDPNTQLMGWIPKTAFTTVTIFDAGKRDSAVDAAVVVDAGTGLRCPAGQEAIVNLGNTAGICRRKCTADKDCRTPLAGACQNGSTAGGKIAKVCANEAP